MRSNLTAGGAYHQGTDFMAAASRLDAEIASGGPEQLRLVAPSIVCTALSIELFFKSMLALAGAPSKGHNLKLLFEKLDDSTKDRLRAALNCSAAAFDAQLSRVGLAFTTWRYAYEHCALSMDITFVRGLSKATLMEAERHFLARGLRADGSRSPGPAAG